MNKYPKTFDDLIKEIKPQIVLIVILSVLGSLAMIVVPIAITKAVGFILNDDLNNFYKFLVIGGLGIFLKQALHIGSMGYAHVIEAKFRFDLRKDFSKKLSKLPLGWFSNISTGEIRKLVADDTIKIHTIIAHGYSEAASAISLPIGCLLVMMYFDLKTALLIMAMIIGLLFIGVLWMSSKNKAISKLNKEFEVAQAQMSQCAIEMVDGIKEIKNFGIVSSVFSRFENAVTDFSKASYVWLCGLSKPMSFISSSIQPGIIGVLTLFICMFALSKSWIKNEEIILFLLCAMALPSSLIMLAQLGNFIRDGKNSVDTLLRLYAENDQEFPLSPEEFKEGDIEFKDVSFGYNKDVLAIDNVSCVFKKGTLSALVGPSGGGKTTISRLIPRFWDVSSGEITINNVNIKNYSENDLLKSIALVFQDVSLMHDSIYKNIALSKPNASKEEVIEAAKSACIHDRIMELPKGYDSILDEGSAVFSGGEKQRVTIARAFLADAPIVILDEATAQADAESEFEIQKALTRLSKGKTVIIIAHRLQTIRQADQILVIDSGKIVQNGKHEELLKQEGVYKEMWELQNG